MIIVNIQEKANTKMATWTVKTYYKKNVQEVEIYHQRDGEGKVTVVNGFRWGSWTVETSDDKPPEFVFTEVPGGDGKKDSIDMCNCRKPLPGALLSAAITHGIDLASSYMIGDRWRDTEAGERAGCKTIFLDYGYDEKQPEKYSHRVRSLAEAVDIIRTI